MTTSTGTVATAATVARRRPLSPGQVPACSWSGMTRCALQRRRGDTDENRLPVAQRMRPPTPWRTRRSWGRASPLPRRPRLALRRSSRSSGSPGCASGTRWPPHAAESDDGTDAPAPSLPSCRCPNSPSSVPRPKLRRRSRGGNPCSASTPRSRAACRGELCDVVERRQTHRRWRSLQHLQQVQRDDHQHAPCPRPTDSIWSDVGSNPISAVALANHHREVRTRCRDPGRPIGPG